MTSALFKHVAVFANSNGSNEFSKSVMNAFLGASDTKFTIVGLSEKLPEYTRFPDENRKNRIEELIQTAAKAVVSELSEHAKQNDLSCTEPKILEGRFPDAYSNGSTPPQQVY